VITVERLVERWEDVVTAVEQIEIEARGIKSQLERLGDLIEQLIDLIEQWLNDDEPEPTVKSYE
jgi:hypothetical protein